MYVLNRLLRNLLLNALQLIYELVQHLSSVILACLTASADIILAASLQR
jgi:hypothetical protein